MTKKDHTNTQNVYNPAAMKAYNAFQPALMSNLLQMAQNPFGTPGFQSQVGFGQAMNNQLSQRGISQNLQNLKAGGGLLSNSAAYLNALNQRGSLAASERGSQVFQNALSTALQNKNYALGAMEGYQPLQTGSQTQQYSTGTGTWLPQVAGLALNALMPGIGGMMAGTGFMSGYRASSPGLLPGLNTAPRIFTQAPPPPISNPWAIGGSGGGYNPFSLGYQN